MRGARARSAPRFPHTIRTVPRRGQCPLCRRGRFFRRSFRRALVFVPVPTTIGRKGGEPGGNVFAALSQAEGHGGARGAVVQIVAQESARIGDEGNQSIGVPDQPGLACGCEGGGIAEPFDSASGPPDHPVKIRAGAPAPDDDILAIADRMAGLAASEALFARRRVAVGKGRRGQREGHTEGHDRGDEKFHAAPFMIARFPAFAFVGQKTRFAGRGQGDDLSQPRGGAAVAPVAAH